MTSSSLPPDHRHWILDRFIEGKRKNPGYSLRSFAKRLAVSPSTLSEILSGKRPVTRKMAQRLSERLALNPAQSKLFLRSSVLARAQKDLPSDESINQLSDTFFVPLDIDKFKLISEWYYYAILSLSEVRGVSSRSVWIAKRLDLPPSLVRAAFQKLEQLGIIQRTPDGAYRQTKRPLSIETQGYETAIRKFLQEGLDRAGKSLVQDPAEDREISAMTLAIDPRRMDDARSLIKRFRRELAELVEKGSPERVYMLAVQFFPIDKGSHRKKDT